MAEIEKKPKSEIEIPLKTTVEGSNINCEITGKLGDFKDFLGLETPGATLKRVAQLSLIAPKLGKSNSPDDQGTEKMLREIQELGPQDAVESGIIIEMVAINDMMLEATAYFHNKENSWTHRKEASDTASKLSRTYQSLVNTLRQWRTQGTQTVKHVHVNDGGQAAFIESYSKGGGVKSNVQNE